MREATNLAEATLFALRLLFFVYILLVKDKAMVVALTSSFLFLLNSNIISYLTCLFVLLLWGYMLQNIEKLACQCVYLFPLKSFYMVCFSFHESMGSL